MYRLLSELQQRDVDRAADGAIAGPSAPHETLPGTAPKAKAYAGAGERATKPGAGSTSLWGGGPLSALPVKSLGGTSGDKGAGGARPRAGAGAKGEGAAAAADQGGAHRGGGGASETPRTVAGTKAKAATDDALNANRCCPSFCGWMLHTWW